MTAAQTTERAAEIANETIRFGAYAAAFLVTLGIAGYAYNADVTALASASYAGVSVTLRIAFRQWFRAGRGVRPVTLFRGAVISVGCLLVAFGLAV